MGDPAGWRTTWWRASLLVALPLAAAGLLVVAPSLDVRWQEPVAHLWLVGLAAAAGTVVAILTAEAAGRRGDVRLQLLGLAFGTSAVFLGVHALATPGALADESSTGFEAAVPAGLAMSAALAALSTLDLGSACTAALLRYRWAGWSVLAALAAAWVSSVLTGTGPLADPPAPDDVDLLAGGLGIAGTVLFAVAAVRFMSIRRARGRARVLAAMVVALVLLADALVVVQVGRNWQASWWEWHLLMGLAFIVVAATVRGEIRREGGRVGLFDSLAMERTLARVRADYAAALDDLVRGLERADAGDVTELEPLVAAVTRRFDLSDRQGQLLREAARALGENRRLYRELERLFRSYLSPDVAAALVAQPDLAALGGAVSEVSVLHADLEGFTRFSESQAPEAVLGMLNAYFGAVVPVVLAEGGTITLFAGDAVMAVFGAPAHQPDHALRACRAGLALQRAADEARAGAAWPRFRVGISTGQAVVGNVGSDALRSFTAIGDNVNLAARLEAAAPIGGVLVSEATAAQAGGAVVVEPVGDIAVKGRDGRVAAYRLTEAAGVLRASR